MPLIVLVLIIAIAWFASHGVYRAVVGTKCAFKGIDPPWVAQRQEQLTNREIRRKQRKETWSSPRTARGFIGRLWGDAWEFANKWADGLGNPESADADLGELDTPDAPSVKPVLNVPADGVGASWVRDLGTRLTAGWARAQTLWDQWWLPSRRRCPWTYLNDETCGRAVKGKQATYCPTHQKTHELGHCLKITAGVGCGRPREGHYPFCSEHLDEVEAGKQPAPAATPEEAEAPQAATLATPDAPELAGVPLDSARHLPTGEPRCQWGKPRVQWLRTQPDYGDEHCKQAAAAGGVHCSPHQIEYGQWEARIAAAQTPEPADSAPAEDDAPAPEPEPDTQVQPAIAADPESEVPPRRPVLRVVPNTNTQGDTDMPAAGPQTGQGPSDHTHHYDWTPSTDPNAIDFGYWKCPDPCGHTMSAAEMNAARGRTSTPAAASAAHTQGETSTMTAPTSSEPISAELTSVQALHTFADSLQAYAGEWGQKVSAAETQAANAGFGNDPAVMAVFGELIQLAQGFPPIGDQLHAALDDGHTQNAETTSGLGNRVANQSAYQNQ